MHSDPKIICQMIELGANSYLTKECGGEKIYEAILACHKHWFFINDTVRNALKMTTPEIVNLPYIFNEKELRIVKLIHEGKEINEIAADVELQQRTVSAILDKLKNKTETKSSEELITYCIREKFIEK